MPGRREAAVDTLQAAVPPALHKPQQSPLPILDVQGVRIRRA